MKKISVSVVIPNYNGKSLLEKNLPSLLKAKENSLNKINQIIIVDDGSLDGSVPFIEKFGDSVKIIKHKKNRGFSASVNIGVKYASGSLVLLLNTDVKVTDNFLTNIFENFNDPKTFAVSLHESGYGGSRGFFSNGMIQLGQYSEDSLTSKTFFVSGGSGVFRKDIWNKLGGMDEKLLSPFYWEDLDLAYRAWKRGYNCVWESRSLVFHQHESTIGKLSEKKVQNIRERNQLLVIWKNIHSTKLIKSHIKHVFIRCVAHLGYVKIVVMALTKINQVLRSRLKEKRYSVISDELLFEKFHE